MKRSHVSNSLEKLLKLIAYFMSSTKVFTPTRTFFISEEVISRWHLSFPQLQELCLKGNISFALPLFHVNKNY